MCEHLGLAYVKDTLVFCSPFFSSLFLPSPLLTHTHTLTGSCETTKIESVNGEASSKYVKGMNNFSVWVKFKLWLSTCFHSNRKGKLFFFYEWNIVLKWTGR